ncbi:hypothetical protein [Clostridium felsineum]|uniref:hypothetical protein n=1 Tax=Clostridium felsineum TaxID=36839 RepID=UPI00098C0D43|nr:hypothetical protein [Clostridium felsineum]URZ15348.1 hypothetical protein CLFE_013660 [Clostridium felsineum DSM 794]
MKLYKLPLGIRIPRDDEYPNGYDVKSINIKRNLANITEGFKINEVKGEKFSHYATINIDADKIWNVFCSLTSRLIDDVAYGIIGFKDDEPILSKFTNTERVIEVFRKYKFELTNDGYLQFGIANYNDKSLNEIFITSFKYMIIWTNNKEQLVQILNSFDIEKVENLQFIDEFPVVSEALTANEDDGIKHYSDVIEDIEKEFDEL